ncbi:MAG: VTT domain-containing protein [Anaerolineae bacterium]|nr:VTT domain-containing protein [Anaerolineae bacterium]
MGNPTLTEQLSPNIPSTDADDHSVSSTGPVEVQPYPDKSVETGSRADKERKLTPRRIIAIILAVLPAVGITLGILWFAPEIRYFSRYGYPGIFLVSLIGNASIALPVPSLAVTFTMGAILNWVIVGLVSGIGEALGETTGYLAGYGGSVIIEDRKMYDRIRGWMEKHGMLTIFLLSAIPNPIIDLAGMAAGASKYGYHKFLFSCWAGKTIKTLIFAWAGSQSLFWVIDLLP